MKINLNLPNKLIIVRFLLTIIIITLLVCIPYTDNLSYIYYANIEQNVLNFVALAIFILAAYTDYLDGKIARKRNQITDFGKIFDPLVDKILTNSILIIFCVFGRIPIWMTTIFILRDFIVDGLRIYATSKNLDVSANKWGKQKTIWQFLGIITLFIVFPPTLLSGQFYYESLNHLALIPLYLALFFSIFSGVKYWNEVKNYI